MFKEHIKDEDRSEGSFISTNEQYIKQIKDLVITNMIDNSKYD